MKWFKRSAKADMSRCHYCGAGLRTAVPRKIVVNGKVVGVHRRHARQPGEVAW